MVHADAEPAHAADLVAAWLAALSCVADSRWRRLGTGPHQGALLEWLEALDLRVVALRLAQPEDFGGGPAGAAGRRAGSRERVSSWAPLPCSWPHHPTATHPATPAGGSPTLLDAAASRLKQVRQHLPGLGGSSAHGEGSAAAAAAEAGEGPPPDGAAPSPQRGSKLRSFLGGKKAAATEAAPPPPAPHEGEEGGGKRGWGERVRQRLAKMGLGGDEQQAGAAASGTGAGALPSGGYSLGPLAEEGAAEGAAPGDTGHLGPHAGDGAGPSGSSGGGQVRRKLASGIQAVGRGLSKVKTRLAPGERGGGGEGEADHDADVAVRLGLAAFAVSGAARGGAGALWGCWGGALPAARER